MPLVATALIRQLSVMRLLLVCLLLATPAFATGTVSLVRVWPGWRDADSFKQIREYFGGEESTRHESFLRTHPESRGGFYFLTRLRNDTGGATPVKIILEVIRPDNPRSVRHVFSSTLKEGSRVYQIGLTGSDWPGPEAHPVAWRLRVFDADHLLLASKQSFLWSLPEAETAEANPQ